MRAKHAPSLKLDKGLLNNPSFVEGADESAYNKDEFDRRAHNRQLEGRGCYEWGHWCIMARPRPLLKVGAA